MNATEIDHLISQIEQLQLTVNRTRTQLTDIRSRIEENDNAQQPPQAEPDQHQGGDEEDPNRDLRLGDRVEILNPVRLRGTVRSRRGVRGTVVRFTHTYVIVRVILQNTNRNGVEQYQEFRRASHNLALILNQ